MFLLCLLTSNLLLALSQCICMQLISQIVFPVPYLKGKCYIISMFQPPQPHTPFSSLSFTLSFSLQPYLEQCRQCPGLGLASNTLTQVSIGSFSHLIESPFPCPIIREASLKSLHKKKKSPSLFHLASITMLYTTS